MKKFLTLISLLLVLSMLMFSFAACKDDGASDDDDDDVSVSDKDDDKGGDKEGADTGDGANDEGNTDDAKDALEVVQEDPLGAIVLGTANAATSWEYSENPFAVLGEALVKGKITLDATIPMDDSNNISITNDLYTDLENLKLVDALVMSAADQTIGGNLYVSEDLIGLDSEFLFGTDDVYGISLGDDFMTKLQASEFFQALDADGSVTAAIAEMEDALAELEDMLADLDVSAIENAIVTFGEDAVALMEDNLVSVEENDGKIVVTYKVDNEFVLDSLDLMITMINDSAILESPIFEGQIDPDMFDQAKSRVESALENAAIDGTIAYALDKDTQALTSINATLPVSKEGEIVGEIVMDVVLEDEKITASVGLDEAADGTAEDGVAFVIEKIDTADEIGLEVTVTVTEYSESEDVVVGVIIDKNAETLTASMEMDDQTMEIAVGLAYTDDTIEITVGKDTLSMLGVTQDISVKLSATTDADMPKIPNLDYDLLTMSMDEIQTALAPIMSMLGGMGGTDVEMENSEVIAG